MIVKADCIEHMRTMDESSVDAIVTDPPYGLEFMGKDWDAPWKAEPSVHADARERRGDEMGNESKRPYLAASVNKYAAGLPFQLWCQEWAEEALRVLKPGGHLVAFGGTRTYHRLACAIEDVGFEIRDALVWMYGSGFPKSMAVDKAIDKAAGAERERVVNPRWESKYPNGPGGNRTGDGRSATFDQIESVSGNPLEMTLPATPEAAEWQGWGTALKPAHEPIVLARKPLTGTVAATVLEHGTGALNIDGCRIGEGGHLKWSEPRDMGYHGGSDHSGVATEAAEGRWPANVILDPEAGAMLDAQTGESVSSSHIRHNSDEGHGRAVLGLGLSDHPSPGRHSDSGGASRFFYCAKATTAERDGATHPTVKPLDLMRWLVRLVTPPNGTVLDPFLGSGTTLIACAHQGFDCIGIEREPEYAAMAQERYDRRFDPVSATSLERDEPEDGAMSLFDNNEGSKA